MSLSEKISRFFDGYDSTDQPENEVSSNTYSSDTDYSSNNDQRGSRVMSIVGKNDHAEKKIMLFEPRVFSDVKQISTRLLDGQAAIINFQRMDDQQIHRIVDFLSGVVFAIEGNIKRIGEEIFLCTPADFEVEGMLTETSFRDF